ncbi:MAG: hypothetical protein JSW11_19440 [Candidatus Heimdallarchaeota archaeon]|nr:MAG: hypothetical protein JSW11_19440 [Candidatus Heimdallarchaeota archaeon]
MDLATLSVLGVIFLFIAIISFYLLGIQLIRIFFKTNRIQTLYLSLIFIFGGTAIVFLVLEQIILLHPSVDRTSIPSPRSFFQYNDINAFWAAYLFAIIAYISSAISIFCVNVFTLTFFPNRSKRPLLLPLLMLLSYIIIILFAPHEFVQTGILWSPEREEITEIIISGLFLPPIWVLALLFFYLSIKMKQKGNIRWRQTTLLGIGQMIISIAYTIEILNAPVLFSLIARIGLSLYPAITYIGVITPKWTKRWLGG